MSVYTCTCIFLAVGYKFVLSQNKYKGEKNSLNGKWEDITHCWCLVSNCLVVMNIHWIYIDTLKSQDVSQEISLHCYF